MTASSRTVLKKGTRRTSAHEERLSQAWQAIINGHGSKEDAELVLADLGEYSGYFAVTEPGTDGLVLSHNEGRRSVYARIVYLLDAPTSYITELRRASLDEMQITATEGEYGRY